MAESFPIDRHFALAEHSGPDKRLSLAESVRRFVRPGMALELAVTLARPNAWIHELLRAFRGGQPGFTLVTLTLSANASLLVHAGLATRAITTFCGDSFPAPAPNGALRRAIRAGRLAVENWSIATLPLRLEAAAMGVPELPTRSLLGSTMAEENAHAFAERDGVGWVKALAPDLTLVHALAADRAGNAILPAPRGEGVVGAFAAREGVLVSAERIVSTEWIRRHSHLGFLPGQWVRAVAEAPLGAHPAPLWSAGCEVEGYADDYAMLSELHDAVASERGADDWLREWVFDVGGHAGYVAKLGGDRIARLRGRNRADAWRDEVAEHADLTDGRAAALPATPVERQVIEAARWIEHHAADEGAGSILAGIGNANLAAWLGARRLAARGLDVALMAELGLYGYEPRPFDPVVFSMRNLATATWLTEVRTLMSMVLPNARRPCIGSIGAAEVGRFGELNTTRLADGTPITGSGGGNDIASAARAVVVTASLAPGRFRDVVGYVTSPGSRVRAVVTERGTFVKEVGRSELALATWLPVDGGASEADHVREIRARVGWDLTVRGDLERSPDPGEDELAVLRIFDPERLFLGPKSP